jgi:AcrR family transcriptional regulator
VNVQRARSEEAKAERLRSIVDAAARCFDGVGIDVTLDQIAVASGLTRTTLYGYGTTKEEILLLLADREVSEWFSVVTPALARARSSKGVVRVLTDSIVERPRFISVLALCGPILERNVSVEAATAWKQRLHDQLLAAGGSIDAALHVSIGSGARLLLHVYAVATGLHSVAAPPAVAAKAIADAGLCALEVDFASELRVAVGALAATLLSDPNSMNPNPMKGHQ